jgi:hypothetical protein
MMKSIPLDKGGSLTTAEMTNLINSITDFTTDGGTYKVTIFLTGIADPNAKILVLTPKVIQGRLQVASSMSQEAGSKTKPITHLLERVGTRLNYLGVSP